MSTEICLQSPIVGTRQVPQAEDPNPPIRCWPIASFWVIAGLLLPAWFLVMVWLRKVSVTTLRHPRESRQVQKRSTHRITFCIIPNVCCLMVSLILVASVIHSEPSAPPFYCFYREETHTRTHTQNVFVIARQGCTTDCSLNFLTRKENKQQQQQQRQQRIVWCISSFCISVQTSAGWAGCGWGGLWLLISSSLFAASSSHPISLMLSTWVPVMFCVFLITSCRALLLVNATYSPE